MMLPLFLFQSTLPRGERLNSIPVIASRHNFNPRSREGSDSIIHILKDHFYISIHAPARGATNASAKKQTPLNISIHAPARGATNDRLNNQMYFPFQSTLPRGERQHRLGGACSCHNFNPRSREGSDFNVYIKIIYHFYFNPRSREGSDS